MNSMLECPAMAVQTPSQEFLTKSLVNSFFLTSIEIVSFEASVPNKKLTVVGPEGIDAVIMEKLTKWVRLLIINIC